MVDIIKHTPARNRTSVMRMAVVLKIRTALLTSIKNAGKYFLPDIICMSTAIRVQLHNCSTCDKKFRSNIKRHVRDDHDDVKKFIYLDEAFRHTYISPWGHRGTSIDASLLARTYTRARSMANPTNERRPCTCIDLYQSQVLPHHCDLCDRGF